MLKWGRITRGNQDETSGIRDWEGIERFMTRGTKERKKESKKEGKERVKEKRKERKKESKK